MEQHKQFASKVGEQAGDLTLQHSPHILEMLEDPEVKKLTFNLAVTVTRESSGYKSKCKITYAKKTTDEREDYVDGCDVDAGLEELGV